MKKFIALAFVFFLPLLSFAQTIDNDEELVAKALRYGNTAISIIIALAVLYIIYGVFKYLIKGANDEESRKAGRDVILWGVVGLFVILSIWGLVAILKNSLRTETQTPYEQFPTLNVRQP